MLFSIMLSNHRNKTTNMITCQNIVYFKFLIWSSFWRRELWPPNILNFIMPLHSMPLNHRQWEIFDDVGATNAFRFSLFLSCISHWNAVSQQDSKMQPIEMNASGKKATHHRILCSLSGRSSDPIELCSMHLN